MVKNTFRTAIRVLLKNKLFSLINLLGLAVGLACFILIALFVHYETRWESSFDNADRIYPVSRDYLESGESTESHPPGIASPVATLLKQDYPQVEKSARIFCCAAVVKTETGPRILEYKYAMADNELFEIFDFDWISGDPATALTEPYTVVLTRSAAERHFGNDDPLGQTIYYGGANEMLAARVTGVIEDPPANSHLDFDFLESMLAWLDCNCSAEDQAATDAYFNSWDNNLFFTYVMLREGTDIAPIQDDAPAFFERYAGEGSSRGSGFTAMPITDIHLYSDRDSESWSPDGGGRQGNPENLVISAAVAVFILALACINFVNLSTARSARRAREVGVRKAAGAGSAQLIRQFLLESVFLTGLAIILAVALVEFALPAFGAFLEIDFTFDYLANPGILGVLVLLTLLVALASGAYPAFYLAAFRPQKVLKGEWDGGTGGAGLRKTLVVVQFTVSIAVLIATAVVYAQMRYIDRFDLGFETDNIVLVDPNAVGGEAWQSMKNRLLAHPDIEAVTSSNLVPFRSNRASAEFRVTDSGAVAGRMRFLRADYGFFDTYGIDLLAGRTFSADFPTDALAVPENGDAATQAFVISADAAAEFGWTPEAAIGQWIDFDAIQTTYNRNYQASSGPVVGVVEDVFFESVHNPAYPLVYMLPESAEQWASVKTTGNDLQATTDFILSTWRETLPAVPADTGLLSQEYDAAYQDEEKLRQTFAVFSLLSVIIACLGLLGLAAYAAERRTREIAIRKVMGCGVWRIVLLLTYDFSVLVLLSNVIAWPVAYFAMNRWLENFAYRIDLTPMIFIGSGLVALCIAWVTVGGTAARAASRKPVLALRYE